MFKNNFQEESAKILGVFYSTRDKLKSLNSKIVADSETKTEQMSKLEEQVANNMSLINSNTNIITNIDKILS